jgi:UDP-N-acetylmuramate--L-alanine ligase
MSLPSHRPQSIHLIGIGGTGMSALAHLLLEAGSRVSGSDAREGAAIQALRAAGADVAIGHRNALPDGVDRVVHSPAIPPHNPELLTARRRRVPVQPRAEALAQFLRGRDTICVAGSHGKTTTTAMLAFVLRQLGLDPGFMIGGRTPALGGRNATVGTGPFVLEACEAFAALPHWMPAHVVLTRVDDEHAEHYGGRTALHRAFVDLIARVPASGLVALCGDNPDLEATCARTRPDAIAAGLEPHHRLRAEDIHLDAGGSSFWIARDHRRIRRVKLGIPGLHNVRNALGVMAVVDRLGLDWPRAGDALAGFSGVDRRWQPVGEANGVRVFDDYAHHPAEIDATLAVARLAVQPGGRVIAAFEPQLHSRVTRLAGAFAEALGRADFAAIAPVDAAGETHPASGDAALASALAGRPIRCVHVPSVDDIATAISARAHPGDVVVLLGAGRISQTASRLLERLAQAPSPAASSVLRGARTGTPRLFVERIVDHLAGAADAEAAVCGAARLTYRDLVGRAASLATRLMEAGIGREDLVAVRLRPSTDRVVAFLGTLMAGGVFMPVDPELPRDRVSFMIEDARARVLIEEADGEPLPSGGVARVLMQDVRPGLTARAASWPAPEDAAYVIYTSGTTGAPKGVVVEHAALANFAAAAAGLFAIGGTSRVSLVSAFGFDVSIGDMAMALYGGASLHAPLSDAARSGALLGRFVRDAGLSHLSLTPSALSSLPRHDYPSLSHVIVAGEVCPPDLAARFPPRVRFFNAYGPTEATVFSTAGECRPGEPVTIGRPLANTDVWILDDAVKPVPVGVTGELWVGGVPLARGYLRRPELTAERFAMLPGPEGRSVRAYRTGDLAHLLPDGRLAFDGRRDRQLKRRGFRIEPEGIEAVLRRTAGVEEAVVTLRRDEAGRERLVAYVVARPGVMVAPDEIDRVLCEWLPAYMRPDAIVPIAAVPLTANGKRNLSALPVPGAVRARTRAIKTPGTAIEQVLVEIIRAQLHVGGEFGVRDCFADLGIDSLRAATLVLLAEARFGVELPAAAVGEADTVELLALHISALRDAPPVRVDRSLAREIQRKQLAYLAGWRAPRRTPDSLIALHGPPGERAPIFWCCQGDHEHQRLAQEIGGRRPVHGMRSGHLVFSYTPDNVAALASLYADELIRLQPGGSFRLGGNCQGGTIAREVALQLRARGREVALLCLMEQGRFPAYDSRVALIFGAASDLNPYASTDDPEKIFRTAYGPHYSVDFIPGGHGEFFVSPSVERLAEVIETRLTAVDHL